MIFEIPCQRTHELRQRAVVRQYVVIGKDFERSTAPAQQSGLPVKL